MASTLWRILLSVVASVGLLCSVDSSLAAQIPAVECQVGDTVIVDFQGRDCEAIVTEVLVDGAIIKADEINPDGSKKNWPLSAEQIKSVTSSGKRDSTARGNLPDKEPATDDQEHEVGAAESEPERTWTSADGKFTASAKLAGKSGNMIRLTRSNGKPTRIEFEKLSDSDRKYIEAALMKAQSEKASDPFSDSSAESKPAKPPVKSDSERTPDQSEKALNRPTETERSQATDRARIAEARSGQPNPQAAHAGMPFLIRLFLRFSFSGFIFARCS